MFTRKTLSAAVQAMVIVFVAGWLLSFPTDVRGQEAEKPAKATEVAPRNLPKDVYPDSGFRLPLPKREDFDEEGQKIFDKRAGTGARSLRGLHGPGGIRLYSPKLADYSSSVSQYLRFDSGFSGRIRELAILVTAREMDSQFEWAAHEKEAVKEGLAQETIDIIKFRKGIDGLPETEATIIQLGRQMFGKGDVDSKTFASALDIFGPRQLVDLVSLMVNYQGTAALLKVFDMQLDAGQKPPLPMP